MAGILFRRSLRGLVASWGAPECYGSTARAQLCRRFFVSCSVSTFIRLIKVRTVKKLMKVPDGVSQHQQRYYTNFCVVSAIV